MPDFDLDATRQLADLYEDGFTTRAMEALRAACDEIARLREEVARLERGE